MDICLWFYKWFWMVPIGIIYGIELGLKQAAKLHWLWWRYRLTPRRHPCRFERQAAFANAFAAFLEERSRRVNKGG